MIDGGDLAEQSCVSSVNGGSTRPWREPVFSVMLRDVLFPVTQSSIQLQSGVLKPRVFSFSVSCCGVMVLNAELKSMNDILTCIFLF